MSPPDAAMKSVLSADGTWIAFEQSGQGPPLILVGPAGRHRSFSASDGLAPLLSSAFTVIVYDRRGRGQSTRRDAFFAWSKPVGFEITEDEGHGRRRRGLRDRADSMRRHGGYWRAYELNVR
jgi:pimeloyl-ACP methyl ester carboxylesterase